MGLLVLFEIINEIYTAIGAGALGILVLLQHGFNTQQTVKTCTVSLITLGSFMYVCQQSERLKTTKKKIVFITGCDSGLGFSLAQHINDIGFTVIAAFLSLDSPGAKSIRQTYGEHIVQIQLDVTDSENVKYVLNFVESYIGTNYALHAVVNNAGVMTFGEFEWLTERLIQQQLDVNLFGTFKVTKAFCPLLRKYRGRVITVTSHCAQATLPGLAVYGATKTALAAWSDGIRVELGKYGVHVVTFIPGSFPTESNIMSRQLLNVKEMHDAFTEEQHDFYEEYFKKYNIYLSYISGPSEPKRIEAGKMYETFDGALLDVEPYAVYKHEPLRYALYHLVFRFSPFVNVRDFLVTKFMQMPVYTPKTCKC